MNHIKPIISEITEEIHELAFDPQAYANRFTSTSFEKLDEHIIGLAPGDLIFVASRPGVGKTTFAVNVAVNIAKKYRDKSISIFSLDMSREQLVKRILASEASVTVEQMKAGDIDKDTWKHISDTTELLSELNIYIDDTTYITVGEMKAKLRRIKNLGVVVIDYLQLISFKSKCSDKKVAFSEITRLLKIMARELGVAVILTSQLSRKLEKRQDKRPQLSDLRDDGAIEQDADVILMLYREAMYDADTEFPNRCQCFIEKNRRGETGVFDLSFEREFYKFSNAEFI
jgi:replicative DNA helicase